MAKVLLHLLPLILQLPDVDSFRWLDFDPAYTDQADVQITQSTVAFLTHCSQKFDPSLETAAAVDHVVKSMKSRRLPVYYLHDRFNNSNPAWSYLYSDWNPTGYLHSDVGNLDLDLSYPEHVVCLGGYFEQCERSTVTDVVRLWRRDGACHDLRITQVADGVFSVLAYMNSGDRYNNRARSVHQNRQRRNFHAVMTLEESFLQMIDEELAPDFLKRQLPPLPPEINVVLDVYGVIYPLQIVGKKQRTLTFAYRSSDRFLDFTPPKIDFSRKLNPRSPTYSSPLPMAVSRPLPSGTTIYGGSFSGVTSSPLPASGPIYSGGVISSGPLPGSISGPSTIISGGMILPSNSFVPSGTVISSQPINSSPSVIISQ